MGRLVDVNKMIKDIKENYVIYGYADFLNDFFRMVEEQPTVDAEPVVRCKDCKWFHFNKTAIWCDNERGLVEPRCDSFCSWGERKDE